jgi:hypothetical protein
LFYFLIRKTSLRGLSNIDDTVADCELEEWSAGAGACADGAFRDAGFLA